MCYVIQPIRKDLDTLVPLRHHELRKTDDVMKEMYFWKSKQKSKTCDLELEIVK